MKKLAIVTTHPIQYNAPFFKLLAASGEVDVMVFYTLGVEASGFTDPGFGKKITWDIPLLEGYSYKFVENVSKSPSTSRFNGIVNPSLNSDIEKFQADHILVYGWSFKSHLSVLRYFKNKAKVYFRGDSTLLNEQPGVKTALRRLWLKWVYSHIDAALYVGTNNKEYYLKHSVDEGKLYFAPHAVENDRFGKEQYTVESLNLKRGLDIRDDDTVFLYAGKFDRVKEPVLLMEAFKRANLADAVLVMVGNGVLEKLLKEAALDDNRIKFLPFQNQTRMPLVYGIADIFVLPSRSETWGLCINEAMACGLGIIASSKVGCAVDLVQVEKNGYIFESGNLQSLISALESVLGMTRDEVKCMGEFSRRIIANWNYQASCDVLINLVLKD